MAVFTHAKKLSEYIFVITEKSPKKLRWSIVARLQNCSVDVIENLYRANYERETEPRLNYQKSASVSLSKSGIRSAFSSSPMAFSIKSIESCSSSVGILFPPRGQRYKDG